MSLSFIIIYLFVSIHLESGIVLLWIRFTLETFKQISCHLQILL